MALPLARVGDVVEVVTGNGSVAGGLAVGVAGNRLWARGAIGQHGGMPGPRWDDVKEWFDPETNGSLPDVYVPNTTIVDWQAVVDLVRSRGWAYEYLVDGRAARIPCRVGEMLGRRSEADVALRVWPAPEVLAIFRPYVVGQIDFDVDLRELQGQERLDVLCCFMRAIGRRLGKPVVLTPEGVDTPPVIGYDVDVDRVVMLAGAVRGGDVG